MARQRVLWGRRVVGPGSGTRGPEDLHRPTHQVQGTFGVPKEALPKTTCAPLLNRLEEPPEDDQLQPHTSRDEIALKEHPWKWIT